MATVATLTFILNWNDYTLSTVFLGLPSIQSIALKVYALKEQLTPDFGLLMAGLTIAVIPVIVFYIIFQEQIVKGMVAGAVKG